MQYGVGASVLLLLAVVYVPFLQSVFDTVPLGLQEWAVVGPLLFVPAIVAEINKWLESQNNGRNGREGSK